MASTPGYTVLVTGGSGFLGQHVVGLLQTHAPHVTEIRVLDMSPYENKLDYEATKPVRRFTGSVDDRELLRRACEGVSCVMHIAGVVDISMFPDDDRLKRINVQATSTLIDVCMEVGVQRFVYCSSVSVAVGYDSVINGKEAQTAYPEKFLFNGYSSTKLQAEKIVLKANCDQLKTVSIRPVAMYGEEDQHYVSVPLWIAQKTGLWPVIDCKDTLHQAAYAGNVAWSFIAADMALIEEKEKGIDISGNAFNIADDTPVADMFEIRCPFAVACNNSTDVYKFPQWLVMFAMYIIYCFLFVLSPIVKMNFPYGLGSFQQMKISYTFNYDKAKTMMGYTPLFDYNESIKRSNSFYKRYSK